MGALRGRAGPSLPAGPAEGGAGPGRAWVARGWAVVAQGWAVVAQERAVVAQERVLVAPGGAGPTDRAEPGPGPAPAPIRIPAAATLLPQSWASAGPPECFYPLSAR